MISIPITLLIYQIISYLGIGAIFALVSHGSEIDFQLLFQQDLIDKIKNFNKSRTSDFQKIMLVFLTLVYGFVFFLPTLLIYITNVEQDFTTIYSNQRMVPATVNDIPHAQPEKNYQFEPFNFGPMETNAVFQLISTRKDFSYDYKKLYTDFIPLFYYHWTTLDWDYESNPSGKWFSVNIAQQDNSIVIPQTLSVDGSFSQGDVKTLHVGNNSDDTPFNGCLPGEDNTSNLVNIGSNSTFSYLTNYKIVAAKNFTKNCIPTANRNLPITLPSRHPQSKISHIDDTRTMIRGYKSHDHPEVKTTIKISALNLNSTHISAAYKTTTNLIYYTQDIKHMARLTKCPKSSSKDVINGIYMEDLICEFENVFSQNTLYPGIEATIRTFQNNTVTDVILTRFKDENGNHGITIDINSVKAYTISGGNFFDDEEILVAEISNEKYLGEEFEERDTFQDVLKNTYPKVSYLYEKTEFTESQIGKMVLVASRFSRNNFSDYNLVTEDVKFHNLVDTDSLWLGVVITFAVLFILLIKTSKMKSLRDILVEVLVPKVYKKSPPVKFSIDNNDSSSFNPVLSIDGNPIVWKK